MGTQSEFGFLGVALDGPVLRVLAHDGIMWDATLNHEFYEGKMKQQVETGYAASSSWIKADGAQIEQVVANARDAMPLGGAANLNATLPADAVSSPSLGQPEPWLVLEVSDTGCGTDEQTRLHAFEPFFTTKPQGKGTGLGLSTVYGIVHQFGGCIHLESQPAIGSSFQLFSP